MGEIVGKCKILIPQISTGFQLLKLQEVFVCFSSPSCMLLADGHVFIGIPMKHYVMLDTFIKGSKIHDDSCYSPMPRALIVETSIPRLLFTLLTLFLSFSYLLRRSFVVLSTLSVRSVIKERISVL